VHILSEPGQLSRWINKTISLTPNGCSKIKKNDLKHFSFFNNFYMVQDKSKVGILKLARSQFSTLSEQSYLNLRRLLWVFKKKSI